MTAENWLTFLLASSVVTLVPGPGVMLLVGYPLSCGKRASLAAMPGIAVATSFAAFASLAMAMIVTTAGTTVILALQFACVAVLVSIAMRMAVAPPSITTTGGTNVVSQPLGAGRTAVIGIVNPKGLIFLAAIGPEFISKHSATAPQVVVLLATFVAVMIGAMIVWVLTADRLRSFLSDPRHSTWASRTGAALLLVSVVFLVKSIMKL